MWNPLPWTPSKCHQQDEVLMYKIVELDACNSTVQQVWDENLNVLWIREGLYFGPEKPLQGYTMHSTRSSLNPWAACGAQPECWDSDITTSYISSHRTATWNFNPSSLPPNSLHQNSPEIHFGNLQQENSVLPVPPTPKSLLIYSCKQHSGLPTSPSAVNQGFPPASSVTTLLLFLLKPLVFTDVSGLPRSALTTNSEVPFTSKTPGAAVLLFVTDTDSFPRQTDIFNSFLEEAAPRHQGERNWSTQVMRESQLATIIYREKILKTNYIWVQLIIIQKQWMINTLLSKVLYS